MTIPAEFLALVTDKNGVNHFISNDFPALAWCPTTSWKPGTVFTVVSDSFLMPQIPPGVAHVSLALLPATHPFSTIMDEQAWFRVHIAQAPGSITYANNKHALQLATITVVP